MRVVVRKRRHLGGLGRRFLIVGGRGTMAAAANTRVNLATWCQDAHRSSDQLAGRSQRSPWVTNGSKSRSNDASVAPREIATAARYASSTALRSERREA